jgi:hypothetical protein
VSDYIWETQPYITCITLMGFMVSPTEEASKSLRILGVAETKGRAERKEEEDRQWERSKQRLEGACRRTLGSEPGAFVRHLRRTKCKAADICRTGLDFPLWSTFHHHGLTCTTGLPSSKLPRPHLAWSLYLTRRLIGCQRNEVGPRN